VDGTQTIVQSCGHYTVGLNPVDGERRWVFDYKKEFELPEDLSGTGSRSAGFSWRITWPGRIPFVRDGIVLDSQMVGYKNDWALTYAFTVENGRIRQLWRQKFPLRCFGQFVVKGDYLYGLDQRVLGGRPESRNRPEDMGAFQCVNIRTGKKPWITDALDDVVQYGSLKDGNPHYIIAGDTVIFHQHDGIIYGKVSPKKAGPFTYVPLSDYAPKGLAMPVVAGGRLLIRRMGGDPSMRRDEATTASGSTLLCFPTTSRQDTTVQP
jgi:outer membrane protein assembly factor BamB